MAHYPMLKDRKKWAESRDEIQRLLAVHIYPYWKWALRNQGSIPLNFNEFCMKRLRCLPNKLKADRRCMIRFFVGNCSFWIRDKPEVLADIYINLRTKL